MLTIKQRLHLIVISIGLFTCYSVFGILQEHIFRKLYYNEDEVVGDQFTFSTTFVCLQCVFYTLLAKIILMTHDQNETTPNETPQRYFAFTAVFYLVGIVTSNAALQFISYPSQVVGKALKPIPTMIFGFWVGGKSYPIHKYFLVLLIVSGAIMFLYKPDQSSPEESSLGYALVGVSLLMNGFTAGVQEKMRSIARPSPLNLMLFLNSWSSAFIIIAVLASGDFIGFFEFCRKHPDILIPISLILLVGGCGQFFTCTMITNYGVVPCCLVLTIRKFFNVAFSVLYFGNVLSIRQWSATALIFASLLADTVLSFNFSKSDKSAVKNSKNIICLEQIKGGKDVSVV